MDHMTRSTDLPIESSRKPWEKPQMKVAQVLDVTRSGPVLGGTDSYNGDNSAPFIFS